MKVYWVIASGEYSDYRVHAVFANKDDAEAAVREAKAVSGYDLDDVWGGGEYVEEIAFYEKGEAPKIVTTYERMIDVYDDGTVDKERGNVRREWEYNPLYERPKQRPTIRFVRAPMHNDKGGRLEIRGSNKKAVDQAFSDNLARLKANAATLGRARL